MKQENKRMTTPIADFVKNYAESNMSRLHMPGHKGQTVLGCEAWDITEIYGADSLYEAEGIIAESERNAAELFGSARTLFSTEGSSQCIRAMLYLTMIFSKSKRENGDKPVVVAARNVHKAFIYAATLLDFDVVWLWPEIDEKSICSCRISTKQVERVLEEYKNVVAVYLTSPDYLGGQAGIKSIAEVCHKNDVILAVDNAHGAYLKFLEPSQHPLDLGADICCDSAHKTLPVLTGGAYLHISKNAPKVFEKQAKYAMELFGSTSPSYLIMASLDMCNQYLADKYREKLRDIIQMRNEFCDELQLAGWKVMISDPLKITIEIPAGVSNVELTSSLRRHHVECEYADPDYLVFMLTPENTKEDLAQILRALGVNTHPCAKKVSLPVVQTRQVMSIRAAMFATPEAISINEAENRICRVPTVSCPPAIPIAVPGELITTELIQLFQYYGITSLDVVKR